MLSCSRFTKPLLCGKFFFRWTPSVSHVSFLEKLIKNKGYKPLVSREKHKLVYEFKWIHIPVGLLRLKRSIPIITCLCTSLAYYVTESQSLVICCFLACSLQMLLVTVASRFLRDMIGKVYVNKVGDLEEVIVSAIDKTGKRIDRSHSPNDLMNLDFTSKMSQRLGFVKIISKKSDLIYSLNVSECIIHDSDACFKLFGFSESRDKNL